MAMKVVALAGGVGGAKLVDGLAMTLPPEDLTIVVNTGDDFEHLGLMICPDLDTVMYTLAGMADPVRGWGRAEETWHFLETLGVLGGPTWFRIGDRDLALHVERTRRLNRGDRLSDTTQHFSTVLNIDPMILPMSDQKVSTIVETPEGEIPFQEYFVAQTCEPRVVGIRFEGLAEALPAPGVLESIEEADLIIVCPSNPWVSVDPILALVGVRKSLREKFVIGISPIIEGKALKGPAAKMFTEMGFDPSALAVAKHYQDFLDGFVIDQLDSALKIEIEALGLQVLITDSMMRSREDRSRLANQVLAFARDRLVSEAHT